MITKYHSRFLMLFATICAAHWLEHIFQMYQVYVMKVPRPMAGGCLGMVYPWLVKTELLHYGYAVVMLLGLWLLRKGFTGQAHNWWVAALVIQFWHHFEHLLLFGQAMTHHYLFGGHQPTSVLQIFFPRIELHMFYNTLVTIPIVVAMVLYYRHRRRSHLSFIRHDGSVVILRIAP